MSYTMDQHKLLHEIKFKTSRSSGAGGQHVNKVESKVTLIWSIWASEAFDQEQKSRLAHKLSTRISQEGLLQLDSSETRSQLQNKEIVTEKFLSLLDEALIPAKKRKPTKIPKSVILERLDRKKKTSQKKKGRNVKNYLD